MLIRKTNTDSVEERWDDVNLQEENKKDLKEYTPMGQLSNIYIKYSRNY